MHTFKRNIISDKENILFIVIIEMYSKMYRIKYKLNWKTVYEHEFGVSVNNTLVIISNLLITLYLLLFISSYHNT